ncbi:peroxiredoxin Q/BCP [Thermoactinomyces sp. DSM 45891]|uniref:thioredoxin-dependent thiol peroxidase n=1 Tax=Thermoactinomyces sp. DSM 45891 TaxID=1761907 RepID=UPI00091D52A2|nr:thioredoxin-dependent thiol peroxidase [Thermoactinomyces sp. DSM 45891]SFX68407.1 peroxiredoxin Q/BCP [Thermoactinomyces sp. DSM 45891]
MLHGQAPDFTLPASNGDSVTLSQFRGKNVILYFYPKDMTPGCTTQACDFRDTHSSFEEANTVILGISRDSVARHTKFIEKYDLPFLLLSDEDGKVCGMYGVYKEKNMFGKKAMGIERSTFVINEEGIIVKEERKVKVKDHVEQALEFIKQNLESN